MNQQNQLETDRRTSRWKVEIIDFLQDRAKVMVNGEKRGFIQPPKDEAQRQEMADEIRRCLKLRQTVDLAIRGAAIAFEVWG